MLQNAKTMKIDSIDIVSSLIKDRESRQVELKETTGQLDRGMESLCAFLNGEGGTVLFGVSDSGKIIGQAVSDGTKRIIADAIARLEPAASVQISYVPIPGTDKKVIVVHAEDARLDRPFMYKGRPYIRIESTTTTMPASTYEHLLLERDGTRHRWESFLNEDLKLSDMDNEEILKTVRLGIENGRLPESTGTDIPTILEKLDLMRDGVLTHAAAILFANRQMLIDYPQCTMRLARFRGTDRREFIDSQRLHGNIFRLFDAAMAFLFKHLNLSGRIEGAVREERLSIPYKALREGVLNSLAHRSYRDAGGSVAVAIYDDRVEIENPGGLPRGWDVDKLKSEHKSSPQNPLIANALYKRGYLETWGRGIKLIMDECHEAGLPEPEFKADSVDTMLVFRYKAGEIGQESDKHPTSTRQVPDKYPTSLEQLVSCVGNGLHSVKELLEKMGLKDRENFLDNYLKPALNEGILEPLYPNQPRHPKQKYRLTETGLKVLHALNADTHV